MPGHGGIFDIVFDGRMIFSNQGRCGPLPLIEDVLLRIRETASAD